MAQKITIRSKFIKKLLGFTPINVRNFLDFSIGAKVEEPNFFNLFCPMKQALRKAVNQNISSLTATELTRQGLYF